MTGSSVTSSDWRIPFQIDWLCAYTSRAVGPGSLTVKSRVSVAPGPATVVHVTPAKGFPPRSMAPVNGSANESPEKPGAHTTSCQAPGSGESQITCSAVWVNAAAGTSPCTT